jgi:hypothetical protein
MEEAFFKPRFVGPRFDNGTLPVAVVAGDLFAYERLLKSLAKHLYLQNHPERKRAPNNFSDFRLSIATIETGSASPALILEPTVKSKEPTLFNAPKHYKYYVQSRDLISDCVHSSSNPLTIGFPQELLSHFNQFGRSLKPGESLELPRGGNGEFATMTPEKRKRLVLAANESYERDVELYGHVTEANWDDNLFTLRFKDGAKAILPMPEHFRGIVGGLGGNDRDGAFLTGVASFDHNDRLLKIVHVESIDAIKIVQLTSRFDELSKLEDGWYDGNGTPPDSDKLEDFAKNLIDCYPEDLPLPHVFPTPDGDLSLEWEAEGVPTVLVDLNDMVAYFHAFTKNWDDIEKEIKLSCHEDYQKFISFLVEYIKL